MDRSKNTEDGVEKELLHTQRIRSRCRPLVNAGTVSAAEVMDQRRDFLISNFGLHFIFTVSYELGIFRGHKAMQFRYDPRAGAYF